MPSAARTELACLSSVCRDQFPLHSAITRFIEADMHLNSPRLPDLHWNAAWNAQIEARSAMLREFARHGVDAALLAKLGERM